MGLISIEGMEFFAYHGVYPEERKQGGQFVVDAEFEADTRRAEISDKLEDTIDYAAIYTLVARHMKTPVNLLEHLAAKIADSIMAEHPAIRSLKLSLSKLDPPIEGTCLRTRVTLTRSRS